ncbi:unnamed protein product [Orchesella dallaii]|uniref:Uncharacterized protein n=1 Tax=Orchesella dallaii TaxID=48710 RepID=A0ABP1RGS4_9HEXA
MRIHPAQSALEGEESHLEAVKRTRGDSFLTGLQLLLHSILSPDFASSYQRTDYISTSTGTCTTLVQRMNSTTSPSGGALLPPAFTFSAQECVDSCHPPAPPQGDPPPATDVNCSILLVQPNSQPNIPQIIKQTSNSVAHVPVSDPINNNNNEDYESSHSINSNHNQLVQTSAPSSPPPPAPEELQKCDDFLRSSSVNIIVPTHGEVVDKQKTRDPRPITLRKCHAAIPSLLYLSSVQFTYHESSSVVNSHKE